MKLRPEKYIYVGCIPVRSLPHAPEDTSPCIQMICLGCTRPMWVSEKKREMKKKKPSKVQIYCYDCLVKWSYEQGFEPELIDITKTN